MFQNISQKQKPSFYYDYQHRKNLITIHITLQQVVTKANKTRCENITLLDFHTYFQKRNRPNKKRKETATKIHLSNNFIIPDAVFQIHQNKKQKLFLLELHN